MKIIHSQTDEREIGLSFRKSPFHRKKQIVKVEEHSLPGYLFELHFRSSKKTKKIFIICDGLKGKVRRISWPQNHSSSLRPSEDFLLDEETALKKVKEELRWFSFLTGLRIKRKYHLEEVMAHGEVRYPVWVVYYKHKGKYNFSIYDALSGKKEDFFGKEIFLQILGLQQKSNDVFSKASTNRQRAIDKERR